jgi:molecular chaperone Hsp33
MVENPLVDEPFNKNASSDVSSAIGPSGFIRITKSHPFWKDPFVGCTALFNGEIADDISFYLKQSEQLSSVVGLAVDVQDGVTAATGFICSGLPGCSEAKFEAVEANVRNLLRTLELVRIGVTADEISSKLLSGLGELTRIRQKVEPRCTCSKAALLEPMAFLNRHESVLEGEGTAQVKCEWCAKSHVFSAADLDEALFKRQRPAFKEKR